MIEYWRHDDATTTPLIATTRPFQTLSPHYHAHSPPVFHTACAQGMSSQLCQNVGARLCTFEELWNDLSKNTGCNLNSKYIWSATPCNTSSATGAESKSGYLTYRGSYSRSQPLPVCEPTDIGTASLRCCADRLSLYNGFDIPPPLPLPPPFCSRPIASLQQCPIAWST